MKRFILYGFIIFILTVTVAVIVALNRLQPVVEREAKAAVKKECPTCELALGGIGLTWGGVKLSDVHFKGSDKGGQTIIVDAPSVVIRPVFSTLLSENLRLQSLAFFAPKIKFIDKDKPGRMPSNESEVVETPPVPVRTVTVENGEFTYVRETKGTQATLTIADIDASIVPGAQKIEGQLTGRIGESGSVSLAVKVPVGQKNLQVDTEWTIKNQDLGALSRFFEPNAGVELQGTMVNGHAITKMRDRHLSASLFSEYKDFNLKLHKMYDRPELQAIVTNALAKMAMREKNTDSKKREEKAETVELEREPGESVVSFTLRGLKEAALAVVM